MKRVLTAVVLIPLIVWLVFKGPFWLITLVVAVVAELGLWEYLTLADATGAKTPRIAAGIAVLAVFLLTFLQPALMAPLLGAITLALYIGRTWGHTKPAPTISPGKSWEGSVASMAGSLIITAILLWVSVTLLAHGIGILSYPGPAWEWFVLAAIVNVAAQVGDLVESAIKRGAGVKDSGSLLPGHGGVLDRV